MTIPFPVGNSTDFDSIPYVDWNEFYPTLLPNGENAWEQGEHVALIGPTGSGKTTLAYYLLPLRKYTVILATKPADTSLDRFSKAHGYQTVRTWDGKLSPKRYPKRVLWPHISDLRQRPNQQAQLKSALFDIYGQGSWSVYVDELYYLTNDLGMGNIIKTYLLQPRSNKISLIQSTQRPAWVPLETYSQSTHIFFWRTRDLVDLRRIEGIASHDSQIVRDAVRRLDFRSHEFLYVNTRTDALIRSIAPAPKEGR